ncbi:hypothetical protein BGW39_005754 [Mortierella sp. 14UC]|nr:hypothetical protein BGW39_005754 [Mortierella sp. 14UC]
MTIHLARSGSYQANLSAISATFLTRLHEMHPPSHPANQRNMATPVLASRSTTCRSSKICQSIGLLPAYTKFFEDENGDKTQLLQMFYNAFLYRESCWSLASPILEQLRSLTIPVSDLGRYSSSLSRLGTLERLHFCLDKVVDYDWNEFEDDDEVTQEVMGATQECSKDLYQSVAQFVENHARLFQGRLKAVTFTDSGLWPNIEQSCPEATRREIIRLLPPLHNPRSLDDTNLVTLAAHLDSTDLTNVARIFNLQGPDYWFHILRDSPQFLQRCRSLKELFMEPLGQGAFAWAVQEKCAFLSGQGPYLEHELISLERISIHESEDALLTTELDDIAVAFSETLESIIFTMAPVLPPPPRTTHIGQGWPDLPVLTNIVANAAQDRLVMDPQLLRRCPNIERVTVVDHTSHYKWRDHQPIQSAQLPKLEHLRLIGTSALTFHPDTLHSTTALEYVHIGTWPNNTGHYFIPTPEELRESFDFGVDSTQRPAAFRAPFRPLWTWDWYLPSLEHLILGGEFAFMFEFMMLQGCPSLYFLALDMKFSNRQIARSITNDDMFLSSTDHNSATSKTALVVPSLRILKLKGQWMLKDSLLPQFLSVMLPNLEYLEEQGMGKYTLDGLVQVVKTKPNRIEELSLDKLVVYEDIEDNSMGLQLCQGDEPVPEESENAAIVVQLGHLKYFFLKDASASAQV